jgi:hypothetical protein
MSLWGVTFRLKLAIDDLLKLEEAIRSGGMDPRVLREFRDAVDHVPKTAWALQELQERQVHQRDAATVRFLLTEERVRRATQSSWALASDLDSQEVTDGTTGAADLFRAIEALYHRLAGLFIEENLMCRASCQFLVIVAGHRHGTKSIQVKIVQKRTATPVLSRYAARRLAHCNLY